MAQKITQEDEGILGEIKEIGCMCAKCNCKRMVPLVVSICDSCLKGKHTSKVVFPIKEEGELVTKGKKGVWRLENWEPLTQEDSDEQNDVSKTEKST